jgi:hypothetical protein
MDKGKGKEKETSVGLQAKKGTSTDKDKRKEGSTSRKVRTLNLNTYKTHALGAYAKGIRLYGSTDNFNSQLVCNFAWIV